MVSVLVIGDAALDVSASAGTLPAAGADAPARISLGVGGQAANVAVRLARREIAVSLASPLADDPAGSLLGSRLRGEGVHLVPLPAPRTTVVVALIDPSGERSMLSDRVSLDPSQLAGPLHGAEWIHCSGYPIADDATGDALAAALAARPTGVPLSVAGGSFEADGAHASRLRDRLARAGVDLLILGRDEAAALLGEPDGAEAPALCHGLAQEATVAVVTAGAAGSVGSVDGELVEVAAGRLPGQAVDATGAGDAYAAVMVAELTRGWPPLPTALRAAMEAAAAAGARVAAAPGAQALVAGEAP